MLMHEKTCVIPIILTSGYILVKIDFLIFVSLHSGQLIRFGYLLHMSCS